MKHFLSILDHTPQELRSLLDDAITLKQEWKAGGNAPLLANKTLAMIFMKPSLRTRVSFEMAMHHLGGHAMYLSPQEIGLGTRESIPDVARVLGSYTQGIMARVFDHAHVTELAAWSPVPVINGLSDFSHPCQAMADMLTLLEHFGSLDGLKIAYVGDSNNVARSLLFITSKLGMQFNVASPAGYTLKEDVLEMAQTAAGGVIRFTLYHDPYEAAKGANVIYTDTWTSMGQEAETAERRKVFPPYQVNAALLREADKQAVVLHCLPAHRGEEITDEVADGAQSLIFQQAENRLHAQKAILVRLMG
jgi:ornithine carbamoyltransferase